MKKLAQKMNNMMFDLAPGPTYLVILGIPIFIVVIIAILLVVAVILIKKARKKRIKAGENPKGGDSPGKS